MVALISMILPFIIKLVSMWVDGAAEKKQISKETKEKFLAFIKGMEGDLKGASEIRKQAQSQYDELNPK